MNWGRWARFAGFAGVHHVGRVRDRRAGGRAGGGGRAGRLSGRRAAGRWAGMRAGWQADGRLARDYARRKGAVTVWAGLRSLTTMRRQGGGSNKGVCVVLWCEERQRPTGAPSFRSFFLAV